MLLDSMSKYFALPFSLLWRLTYPAPPTSNPSLPYVRVTSYPVLVRLLTRVLGCPKVDGAQARADVQGLKDDTPGFTR